MKFKVNDLVIHRREGLSTIIEKKDMNGNEYFLVRVSREDSDNIYVPFSNVDTILRNVMNQVEADSVLKRIQSVEREIASNTKQRRDSYKRRLCSGEVFDIAFLFKQYLLYLQEPDKIKLGSADLDMLMSATRMFLDELALSYNIERHLIQDYIINRLKIL